MNITEKLVAAGLVNRDFTLTEGATALGISTEAAALALGAEVVHNDSLDLVFRVGDTDYDDLYDIPDDTDVSAITAVYHLYVEPEVVTRFREKANRIMLIGVRVAIVICGLIALTAIIVGGIK